MNKHLFSTLKNKIIIKKDSKIRVGDNINILKEEIQYLEDKSLIHFFDEDMKLKGKIQLEKNLNENASDSYIGKVYELEDTLEESFIEDILDMITEKEKFKGNSFRKIVKKSFNDPNLYIIVTASSSLFGKLIRVVSGDPYNHASLSFDPNLDSMVSFNIAPSGLVWENILTQYSSTSKFEMFSVNVGIEKKKKALEVVEEIGKGKGKDYRYNMTGVLLNALSLNKYTEDQKQVIKTKEMFCSQFVYSIFEEIDFLPFNIDNSAKARPYDLIKHATKDVKKVKDGFLQKYYLKLKGIFLPKALDGKEYRFSFKSEKLDKVQKKIIKNIKKINKNIKSIIIEE